MLLQEAIDRVNELFGGEDLTDGDKRSWLTGIAAKLMENGTLVEQAMVNAERQFLESPDLCDAVTVAVLDNQDAGSRMADAYTHGGDVQAVLIEILGRLVHLEATERRAA